MATDTQTEDIKMQDFTLDFGRYEKKRISSVPLSYLAYLNSPACASKFDYEQKEVIKQLIWAKLNKKSVLILAS